MKLVKIEWLDSHSTNGWIHPEEGIMPLKCESVGWVVDENKDAITLVQSKSEGGEVCNTITIPRVAVVDAKMLGGLSGEHVLDV